MKEAGCMWTAFGIETGDDIIMKNINKKINNERVIRAFDIFKKQGIARIALMMVGNPGETQASINETKKLMRRIRPESIATSKTMVLPDTDLYEQVKETGWLKDDYWLTDAPPPYYTVEHSEEQLEQWMEEVAFSAVPFTWKLFGSFIFNNGITRTIRDWVAEQTGIRLTREGLQFKRETVPSGLG
jgi:radical SAM superfamily enzyme YgiQ (UPF0313 family)